MAQRDPTVRLVVRSDDAGAFHAGNLAIAAALPGNLVRNVSLMAPAPHFEDTARLLRGSDLCVGLHVTLTSEWPNVRWGPVAAPAAITSLVGSDGAFYRSPLELFEHGVVLEQAMTEVCAQLARARAAGLEVRYLDEHMGVGWVHAEGREQPRLRDLLRAWAESEGLLWHEHLARDLPSEILSLQRDHRLFARAIGSLPPDVYVWVTHPALDDGEVRYATGSDEVARDRALDLAALRSPEIAEGLADAGVGVVRYDEATGG